MIKNKEIKRGDVFNAKLNPVIGSEQGGKRPVVIISNDIGNRHSPTVIIAAITGMNHKKANIPTHVAVKDCEYLEKDSIVLLEQIRTLDKQRIGDYLGSFDKYSMLLIDEALAISIGISKR